MTFDIIGQPKQYTKGDTEINYIGGLKKAHKVIRNELQMISIEAIFMNIAFKTNRSENQRETRRAKR